ncbi:hypothetical protein F511_37513 [Dorcoceras hygrometricum]|uniref:Uncharacterized protein n=1 Tax=Dorcoceras hygrometricum TaxID=472368 RepID=A0A2Z7BP47_9LAMI|nr:hypothetical protein F511_37513 [Dorcoceras hygrometricum]
MHDDRRNKGARKNNPTAGDQNMESIELNKTMNQMDLQCSGHGTCESMVDIHSSQHAVLETGTGSTKSQWLTRDMSSTINAGIAYGLAAEHTIHLRSSIFREIKEKTTREDLIGTGSQHCWRIAKPSSRSFSANISAWPPSNTKLTPQTRSRSTPTSSQHPDITKLVQLAHTRENPKLLTSKLVSQNQLMRNRNHDNKVIQLIANLPNQLTPKLALDKPRNPPTDL